MKLLMNVILPFETFFFFFNNPNWNQQQVCADVATWRGMGEDGATNNWSQREEVNNISMKMCNVQFILFTLYSRPDLNRLVALIHYSQSLSAHERRMQTLSGICSRRCLCRASI